MSRATVLVVVLAVISVWPIRGVADSTSRNTPATICPVAITVTDADGHKWLFENMTAIPRIGDTFTVDGLENDSSISGTVAKVTWFVKGHRREEPPLIWVQLI